MSEVKAWFCHVCWSCLFYAICRHTFLSRQHLMVSEFSPEGLRQTSDQRLITRFVSLIFWRNLRFSFENTKTKSSSLHPSNPRPVLIRRFKMLPKGETVIQPWQRKRDEKTICKYFLCVYIISLFCPGRYVTECEWVWVYHSEKTDYHCFIPPLTQIIRSCTLCSRLCVRILTCTENVRLFFDRSAWGSKSTTSDLGGSIHGLSELASAPDPKRSLSAKLQHQPNLLRTAPPSPFSRCWSAFPRSWLL